MISTLSREESMTVEEIRIRYSYGSCLIVAGEAARSFLVI